MTTKSANRSLLVVGSVAFDDVDGPFGPKPDLIGGSASFFATAASYFTKDVRVVAVVGDDFPQSVLDSWEQRGIDTSGIERVPGKTFRWKGRYAEDLSTRETLDTQLGVFADFKPKLPVSYEHSELVFLGNIHPQLQGEVLDQVRAPEVVAADTMNFWIEREADALRATLKRVHTVIFNDEEARQLAGTHNLVRAARKIIDMGPHSMVIKRGDAGALLFSGDHPFAAPALPLADVVDPTGAGDTFAGGFMGYLAYAGSFAPEHIRTAMIYGSVMASFCVEKFSLDGLVGLSPARIQERFNMFLSLTRFESITL